MRVACLHTLQSQGGYLQVRFIKQGWVKIIIPDAVVQDESCNHNHPVCPAPAPHTHTHTRTTLTTPHPPPTPHTQTRARAHTGMDMRRLWCITSLSYVAHLL